MLILLALQTSIRLCGFWADKGSDVSDLKHSYCLAALILRASCPSDTARQYRFRRAVPCTIRKGSPTFRSNAILSNRHQTSVHHTCRKTDICPNEQQHACPNGIPVMLEVLENIGAGEALRRKFIFRFPIAISITYAFGQFSCFGRIVGRFVRRSTSLACHSKLVLRASPSPSRCEDQRNRDGRDACERAGDHGRPGHMGLETVPQSEQDAEEAGGQSAQQKHRSCCVRVHGQH
jgi:hypothetical protein